MIPITFKNKIKFLKVIGFFYRPFKERAFFVLIAMFVSGFLESLNMAVLYPVVNYGLGLENNSFIIRLFNCVINYFANDNYFMFSCLVLFGVTCVAVLAKYVYSILANKLTSDIVVDIEKKIFQEYINADYAFFTSNQQGKMIHMATIAPTHIMSLIVYLSRLVYDVVNCLFMFALLLILSRKGTFLVMAIALIYGVLVKGVIGRMIYKCGAAKVEEDRKKNVILNELITGIKSIRVFLGFEMWVGKHRDAVERSAHNLYKMLMGRVFPNCFAKFILFGSLAFIGFALSLGSRENLIASLPLFGTFAMVASQFFPKIQAVGLDVMMITEQMPSAQMVYDLHSSETRTLMDGTRVLGGFNHEIFFQDVWFRYDGSQEFQLRGVNLCFEKNKMTAIVGSSGAGKTTLINLLLKLYQPTRGHVRIDGVNIFDYTNQSYLSRIGYVSQETYILNDTIRENIRFCDAQRSDSQIIEAAQLANAHDFIQAAENGYDTVVGDAGMKLSGGQRQRIAIARAILRKPQIIIFDEATSSLDNIAEKKVQDAIARISQDTTVIVVAHRLSTIQNADKIIVLEDGVVQETGTHSELLQNNGLYFQLYTKQDTYSDTGINV